MFGNKLLWKGVQFWFIADEKGKNVFGQPY